MKLLIFGDGERDGAALPHIIRRIVQSEFTSEFRCWRNYRAGGYDRQVMFAIREARDADCDGVVAVIDRDKVRDGSRLRRMLEGRAADRSKHAPFPAALGEAVPHGEAWLLDDPVAVRRALGLPADFAVVSLRKVKSPKEALNELMDACPRNAESRLTLLAEIAKEVDVARCNHSGEIGLEHFSKELAVEILPLCSPRN